MIDHTCYAVEDYNFNVVRNSLSAYGIEDLDSGEDTDDEEAPRKEIPKWAEGEWTMKYHQQR